MKSDLASQEGQPCWLLVSKPEPRAATSSEAIPCHLLPSTLIPLQGPVFLALIAECNEAAHSDVGRFQVPPALWPALAAHSSVSLALSR